MKDELKMENIKCVKCIKYSLTLIKLINHEIFIFVAIIKANDYTKEIKI